MLPLFLVNEKKVTGLVASKPSLSRNTIEWRWLIIDSESNTIKDRTVTQKVTGTII